MLGLLGPVLRLDAGTVALLGRVQRVYFLNEGTDLGRCGRMVGAWAVCVWGGVRAVLGEGRQVQERCQCSHGRTAWCWRQLARWCSAGGGEQASACACALWGRRGRSPCAAELPPVWPRLR